MENNQTVEETALKKTDKVEKAVRTNRRKSVKNNTQRNNTQNNTKKENTQRKSEKKEKTENLNNNKKIAKKESESKKKTTPKFEFKKDNLKIIPLGGLDEIGKNITVFEYGNEIVLVDCGLEFPGDDMLGVD